MLLGTHVSIAGGYMNALREAKRLGIDAMQIFTKNQRFWQERLVNEEEGLQFREGMKAFGVKQAFSHAIYLISLGSESEEIIHKSKLSLVAELERCRVLGLTHTVLHPGSAGKSTNGLAIIKIGEHLKEVLQATANNPVKILLENTAGQGTSIGGKIEHLAALMNYINSPRIGLCIDTCHAFAAGYDIRTNEGLYDFFSLIEKEIGISRLLCFHLNDSRGTLGSKLDRHAHIGEGLLGLETFKFILQYFRDVPKVLETSKENDADMKNLAALRSLPLSNSKKKFKTK